MARVVEVAGLQEVPEALRDSPLVVVRGLELDIDDQVAFTARLGALVTDAGGRPQVRIEGDQADPAQVFVNEQWHVDLSWCKEGPVLTVLHAMAVGPSVAPTSFVDMVTAFERLTVAEQAAARGWRACHHVERSRAVRYGLTPAQRPGPWRIRGRLRRSRPAGRGGDVRMPTAVAEPGAVHPVVVRDPRTTREALMLGDHAWTLAEHPPADGLRLVDALQARAVEVGERSTHHWRQGDVLVFDNRVLLHRRDPSPGGGGPRVLRRTVAWPHPAFSVG